MIETDEDALICDLAETYGIFDYKRLPAKLVAVFACGLKPDSRIKKKLAGVEIDLNTILLAGILDGVNLLVWSKTKDAAKGKNRPESILQFLSGEKPQKDDIKAMNSVEEFERERKRILGGT